jgi:NAD(P)-dependent dehydrogenase (short-subunit alcohol dehydrogenase family)
MLTAVSTPFAASGERVALVTGASSGIGEASARRLARSGFRVVLAARRAERLESIAKEISTAGGEALAVAVDLADSAATSHLVEQTRDAYGRVDVLVNNAGFSPGAALEQITRSELRQIFEVNLFSALQLVGEVVPLMRAQGGGRIINIGSLGGYVAAPLAIPYAATKAGLDAATRGMRLELAPWRIRVSLVIPGFVDTAVFENARKDSQHLRDDPKNPYRKLFVDLDEFTQKSLKSALAPDDVAKVVVIAATVRRPRLRYYTPVSTRLQTGFLGMLPESLLDRILLRLYKIEVPGRSAPYPSKGSGSTSKRSQ